MMAHAEALEFEQAAEIRDQIGALSRVLHQQSVEANSGGAFDKDVDILAVKVQGGRACVNLAMVRGGRHLGDRPYFPDARRRGRRADRAGGRRARRRRRARGAGARGLHRAALPRRAAAAAAGAQPCRRQGADRRAVEGQRRQGDGAPPAARTAAQLARHGACMAPSSRWRGCWPKRARSRPARARWPRRSTWRRTTWTRFRIECFDISHTAGEATQASCVVFEGHKMQSAQYRRYNIEGITGGDDYAAMRQVLMRRYGKLARRRRERRGSGATARACPTWCWSTAAAARWRWRARCSRNSAWTCR